MDNSGFSKDQLQAQYARKVRDDRKIAKAAQEQAAAQKEIADQAAIQTELLQQTESLKQQAIREGMALQQRVSDIKKKLARLRFDLQELTDEPNGIAKAQKFQSLDRQIDQDFSTYKDEVTDLGEPQLVDELLSLKRTLGDLKTSYVNDPDFLNSLELLETHNLISGLNQRCAELQQEKDERIKADEIDQNKNRDFEKDYCQTYNIDEVQFKERVNSGKVTFSSEGGLIVFVRRVILLLGWLSAAAAALVVTAPDGQEAAIGLSAVAVILLVVGFLTGRKTVKRRLQIKALKKEFKFFAERMVRIEDFRSFYGELASEISGTEAQLKLAKKEMEHHKKNALELGKTPADLEILFAG